MPTPKKTFERTRVIAAGISALILTVGLSRFAYTPMLPIMHDEASLSHVDGGYLATANYAGYMSGTLLAATISDVKHKFLIYRAGLVIAVLSTMAMGATNDVTLWLVLRFIGGFSSIAGLLLASGLVLNWLIRHGHTPVLGLHFMGLGLGIVVSGLAVAAIDGWFSWRGDWLGLGLLGLAFFVPAWVWLPPPPADGASTPANVLAASEQPTSRWMWLLIATYFCAGFGYVISATFIVAILAELPALAGYGSWVWVMVGSTAAPSCFLWDRVALRLGEIPALMIAFALQTVSIILPVVTSNVAVNILGALIYGATFVGIVSLTLTLVGRHFPANPAKAMARMTLSYGVAQIAAPALAGHIATRTGSYHGALIVTAIVMLVGLGLLQALRWEERP